jgi:hypothetical protein
VFWPARRDERRLRLAGLAAIAARLELGSSNPLDHPLTKNAPTGALCVLARPERFELPTPRFEAWCSIQLSYGRRREA